jgi:hypothetical protein
MDRPYIETECSHGIIQTLFTLNYKIQKSLYSNINLPSHQHHHLLRMEAAVEQTKTKTGETLQ